MAPIKDQAIVLRRLDYSETSQVLLFLTREHGPRRLIAKGIKRSTKKKFATGIDLLERGEIMFTSRLQGEGGLGVLTEWRQTHPYLGLRQELRRWYAAQYAAEIAAAMTEEADPQAELFDALGELLASLAGGAAVLPRVVGYQRRLLTIAGLWPDLTRCVNCDRPAPPGRAAYYAVTQGGLVCRQCAPQSSQKRLIDAATLEALRTGECPEPISPKAFAVLNETISSAMGHAPVVGRFVGT